METAVQIVATAKLAWWVTSYVQAMGMLSAVLPIDEDKVVAFAMHGISVSVHGEPA